MEMPDFKRFRYLVIKDGDAENFSAYWIHPKGRLVAAKWNEVAQFDSVSLERIPSPELIGLNYRGPHALDIYRTLT